MPAVPSRILAQQYADLVMQNYNQHSFARNLRQINDWLGCKDKECLGIPVDILHPNINYQQKPWIAKFAKEYAKKKREEYDSQHRGWYPTFECDLQTEEPGYDIYD